MKTLAYAKLSESFMRPSLPIVAVFLFLTSCAPKTLGHSETTREPISLGDKEETIIKKWESPTM